MTKVIVITGAGSGLGRYLAKRFATDGDQVVLLGRTLGKLESVANEIGKNALPLSCDISSPVAVGEAFSRIAELHPQIDVLINNAANIDYSPFAEASDQHVLETVNTNLIGTIFCTRAALIMMRAGGHIINVSSASVDLPYPHHTIYQATKGAIETMSRHLQLEFKPRGIRVSVVRAGPMGDGTEERALNPSPQLLRFLDACVERGLAVDKTGLTQYESAFTIFRLLVDSPADVHIDTIRFDARLP